MKVLFVQEQTFLATALRLAMLTRGYELVVSNENIPPSHALDIYNPNIVIADITRGSGLCYVEEARKKNVPVIVICNNEDEEEINNAFKKGADDYISMPLSFTELAIKVNLLMQKSAVA